MKKKILIVGGSHSEVPLIKAAKELGLYVITTGNQANGLGHQHSDEFHIENYADKEAIYQLAKKLCINFICFGAHDLSMFSTVYTASKLGLNTFDDYEVTQILHHKDMFKTFSKKHNILTPKAYSFDTPNNAINFAMNFTLPFIIKPVDMGGGKGIAVVKNRSQIKFAIENAFNYSKNKRVVIEEFFEGSLHSFSTFIQDQKIVFYYADDEYACKNNPYGVCTSASPATNFEKVQDILIEQTNKISQLLNLKDGLLHMQYLQQDDTITIVEFTRRMPGDMYNIPVELSTGVEYAKSIIRFCCGLDIDMNFKPQKHFVSRHCIIADSFNDIVIKKEIKNNIKDKIIWGNTQGIEKKGIIFLQYNSYEEMIKKTININKLITIH